jgi:phospholipase/lecithinase/hemolysin
MNLKRHLPRLGLALALLSAPFVPAPAWAGISALTNLFVIGDSLSDGGNSGALTGGSFPTSPPYSGNRYSNGPVAVEYLWQAFNPDNNSFRPSLTAGGTNFALGGATTGNENFVSVWDVTDPFPLIQGAFAQKGNAWQLDAFTTLNPTFNPYTSLFVVWLFPNDVFYLNNTTPPQGVGSFTGTAGAPILPQPDVATQLIGTAVTNISGTIVELAGKGARNFLVVNSPDLGLIPEFLNAPEEQKGLLSALSGGFNTVLNQAVSGLATARPDLDITLFEIDKLFAEVRTDKNSFGLDNVIDRCLVGATICADPDAYLFWDGSHPTTAAHAVIGQRFFQAVYTPVPGPLPAMGVVVVLGWSRRLRSRMRQMEAGRLQASEPKNQP